MSRRTMALAAIAFVATPVSAYAEDFPSLVGTWLQTSLEGARFGKSGHLPAEDTPSFLDNTAISFTLVIEQQQGAGLIGKWSSKAKTEKLVGVIKRDKTDLLLADEDTLYHAVLLSPDEMEICAHDTDTYSLAACHIMKRQ